MAKPGPKPVSPEFAELFGLPIPSLQGMERVVPEPLMGDLVAPERVGKDHAALDYFELYVKNTAPGHLRPLDVPLLADLCIARAIMDSLQAEYADEKYKNQMLANGLEVPNPKFDQINKIGERIRKLSSELALTIAERGRVKPIVEGEEKEKKKTSEHKDKYLS